MAHIQFLTLAAPDTHKRIMKEINQWKYEIEGDYFKGVKSPFISEVRMYDVRIREEHIPQFMRDFELGNLAGNDANKDQKVQGLHILQRAYRWVSKLMPYKKLPARATNQRYKIRGWHYSYALGKLDDPQQKTTFTGKKREIL